MFSQNQNNFDPALFYNMMMAHQQMMNLPMPGMPQFPPNMPPFPGMPSMPGGGMPPPLFGSGVPQPPFFPPGMPLPTDEPNSGSPKHNVKHEEQEPSIPESILRSLPSSARPLTVADLERNLLSKN